VLKRLLLSSKQGSPKYQWVEEEYNNSLNSCIFPRYFQECPASPLLASLGEELVRRRTIAMCYYLLPRGKQRVPWDITARGNNRGRIQV